MSDRARFWLFTLAALVVYLLSPIIEWGDSLHYALMIERSRAHILFEPAHLLWRPIGWVLWRLAQRLEPAARPFRPLQVFTLVASALGVGTAAVWLRRRVGEPAATAGAAVFALGYAYWSYATSACAYAPAATAGLASLALAWPEAGRQQTASRLAWAAALQTIAVCLWLPMILGTPAICFAAAIHRDAAGGARMKLRRGLACGAMVAALTVAIFALAWQFAARGHEASPAEWFAGGTHGEPVRWTLLSISRAAYGWTRLLWQARYVALDPGARPGAAGAFTRRALFEWGMWKILASALLAALAVAAGALRRARTDWLGLAILAFAVVPHVLLAAAYNGGDSERWLPAWPAILCGGMLWTLGSAPSASRRWWVTGVLAIVVCVNVVQRFGPDGNVFGRPQMRMILEARAHVRPGDTVFLGGEFDDSQQDRTRQTAWGIQWIYFTAAGGIDVWTWPMRDFRWGEMRFSPTGGPNGHGYAAESLLRGIAPGAAHTPRAGALRQAVLRRLKPGPLQPAFVAGGEKFFELEPEIPGQAAIFPGTVPSGTTP